MLIVLGEYVDCGHFLSEKFHDEFRRNFRNQFFSGHTLSYHITSLRRRRGTAVE